MIFKVGAPFLDIEVEDDVAAEQKPGEKAAGKDEKTSTSQEKPAEVKGKSGNNKFLASPAVRNMLKVHTLDINKITGTGKDGRILKEDVNNYINKSKVAPKAAAPKSKETEKK